MRRSRRRTLARAASALLALCLLGGAALSQQAPRQDGSVEPAFQVDGRVALASLMSLADGHLMKMADFLAVLASGEGRSARWEAIRGPLAEVGRHNVPAVLWFALPDGSYWTGGEGRISGSLAGRAYFPRLLAGQTVLGDLVVSQSTGRSVAIVAVPIRRADGSVAGALGSSIYLDSLSLLLDHQMALPKGFTFYSIDSTPIGALNRNPDLIFTRPLTLGEDLSRAIREMLGRQEGVVSYRFLDAERTVVYRRSPVTGWWYGLGLVRGETGPEEREVVLGGLFALTGSWSTQGQSLRAAMELAIEDVNRYLEGNAAGIRFIAAVEDTRLEPALALEQAKALRERGAQLLIGPQSSAEVAHLKPFVDSSGILLVSPASTAGTLAIAGDNIFRFTPSDSLEAVAISALMWEDGVRAVVPVWRNDAGNAGLVRATRGRFSALGGAVLGGVEYGDTARDFSATTRDLGGQVRRAVARYGARKVAVYLAAFDEAAALFARAGADRSLGAVRWYGSDGAARSDSLLADSRAAAFAIRTGFPNPVFGVDEGARDIWEPLAARIRSRTKAEPDAFALAVYDAVWVIARGYVASGATPDIDQLKDAFSTAAATQFGATGWTVLNAAGDRKYGDFDFWAVRQVGGVPAWTRVARYETRTRRVVR